MLSRQLLDGLDDLPIAATRAHRGRRIVRVATGAIPVAWNRFGVKGDIHLLRLADADHQVARHPQMIPAVDALARTHLVLPLPRHHLRVGAGNRNPSIDASLIVCLHDIAPEGTIGACTAVVWALRSGIATQRPSQWCPAIALKEGVLLLDSKPWLLVQLLVKECLGGLAGVGRDRLHLGCHALAQDQNVLAAAEWICEDGDWLEEDLRV